MIDKLNKDRDNRTKSQQKESSTRVESVSLKINEKTTKSTKSSAIPKAKLPTAKNERIQSKTDIQNNSDEN